MGLSTFAPFTGPRIFGPLSSLNSNAALKNRGRSAKRKNGRMLAGGEREHLRDTADVAKVLRYSRGTVSSAGPLFPHVEVT